MFASVTQQHAEACPNPQSLRLRRQECSYQSEAPLCVAGKLRPTHMLSLDIFPRYRDISAEIFLLKHEIFILFS